MQQSIDELQQLITAYAARFREIPAADLALTPAPGKWSKLQVIGHLADSAQNNIQRFIRAQYESRPHIVYDQDQWVALQYDAGYPADDLIRFWELLNLHLCRIWQQMPADASGLICDTGKEMASCHSLSFLATDYIAHLKHHLEQIFP